MNDRPQLHPMLKLALDLGPLLLFFFANAKPALFEPWIAPLIPAAVATGERAGIFVATAVFMIAILAALVISYALTRRLPAPMLVPTSATSGPPKPKASGMSMYSSRVPTP